MAEFLLQQRTISRNIWVPPSEYKVSITRADSVEKLREQIRSMADRETLNWRHHLRIVTRDGEPVERWVVRPGSAKRRRMRRW